MKKAAVPSVLNGILIILTLVAVGLLIMVYLSGQINPNEQWRFSYFGLLAPVIITLNILLSLVWIIRWHFMALVPLVALLLGLGMIGRHFQPAFFKTYDNHEETFKVMTFNVRIFADQNWKSTADSVLTAIRRENPDILCIQEFNSTPQLTADSISALLPSLPYKFIHYIKKYGKDDTGYGMAIYSRYPVVGRGHREIENATGGMIYCDVAIKKDTLRVFNNHLQTSNINRVDQEFLSYDSLVTTNGHLEKQYDKIKQIAGKLKVNNQKRALQADSIAIMIQETPYPVIVCGDFNDVPASYTYTTMRGKLHDTFVTKGKGYGFSYNGLYDFLRIDFIFYNAPLKCTRYYSPENLPYSDHNPVIAGFYFEK